MLRAHEGRAYSRAYARALEKFSEHLKLLEHYFSHSAITSLYNKQVIIQIRCYFCSNKLKSDTFGKKFQTKLFRFFLVYTTIFIGIG